MDAAEEQHRIGAGECQQAFLQFGEYNGLPTRAGSSGQPGFVGGGSYRSDSVTRWNLHANDVGLQASDARFDFREPRPLQIDLGLR